MKTAILFLSLFAFNAFSVWAQDAPVLTHEVQIDIPEVAILDLEAPPGTSIVLAIEPPEEAGMPVSFENATDSSLWLNYSSVIGSSTEPNREISVELVSGTMPRGTKLRVKAEVDVGEGDGQMGLRNNWRTINNSAKTVIRNIRTCYTGDGVGKGHNLYYSLELKNGVNAYSKLDFEEATTVTVLYTISNI